MNQNFLPVKGRIIFPCIPHLFTHSSVDRLLGSSHLSALMDNAAMNMGMQTRLCILNKSPGGTAVSGSWTSL